MKLGQKVIFGFLILLLSPIVLWNNFNIYSDIKDSHHDFSGTSWTSNEVCTLCHAPHNIVEDVTPLWNHELSTISYNLYSSSTINATIGQPTAQSKLCLSCHDGTVAIDNIGGNSEGTRFIKPFGKISADLKLHHPISFTYNSNLALSDGQLADPSTEPSGLGGTIEEDLLANGEMQCTSCHDVHVSRNTQGCRGCHSKNKQSLSIWKPNTNSALCLTCHIK
jgi:hypothetical protein